MNTTTNDWKKRVHDLFDDVARAAAAGFALTMLSAAQVTVLAQSSVGGSDLSFIEAAIKQGGLFGLMVLVMFFYRRDWTKLNTYQQATNETLIKLVSENIEVMTELRDELRNRPCITPESVTAPRAFGR